MPEADADLESNADDESVAFENADDEDVDDGREDKDAEAV